MVPPVASANGSRVVFENRLFDRMPRNAVAIGQLFHRAGIRQRGDAEPENRSGRANCGGHRLAEPAVERIVFDDDVAGVAGEERGTLLPSIGSSSSLP